ncbi:hypothetical protein F0344_31740 [Streptomyces finlayi]|uniref:Uncharacterized protein n=1 Tax=Streptomyces finlayi TaxID=67296 RepID=A0A7G7BW00_9ACTN|nr:hypothetical protein [Streptomyces finlayi]QNE79515.1 hypothetical protein F0344_31740 [Streptomyces finlayi]
MGVAVTAVSGCVAVEPQAAAPPRPGTSGPVQDVAPQIVQPPVRESLESLPDPTPSAAAPSERPSDGGRPEYRVPQQQGPAPAPPRRAPHRSPRVPSAAVPAVPGSALTGTDVCALGRGYGGWSAGSTEARICEETYDP